MTLEELTATLQTTGLPVAYRAWPENNAPSLPYICYLVIGSDNFAADGTAYFGTLQISVELYTETKDQKTEALVETALANIYWEKSEEYLDSEKCYQITYEIEV